MNACALTLSSRPTPPGEVCPRLLTSAGAVAVTATDSIDRLAPYLVSVLAAACVTVKVPTVSVVTVIVCAVFQFDAVNITVSCTVAWLPSLLDAVTATGWVGSVSSTTV